MPLNIAGFQDVLQQQISALHDSEREGEEELQMMLSHALMLIGQNEERLPYAELLLHCTNNIDVNFEGPYRCVLNEMITITIALWVL